MISQNDILQFAHDRASFSVRDLISYFESIGIQFSRGSIYTRLRRMVTDGFLAKNSFGTYSFSKSAKSCFIPHFDEEMADIERFVKQRYPFLDICVWNLSDIKSLSHYVAKTDIIFVEVERDAMEGVFTRLSEISGTRRVFLNPTGEDYPRYICWQPSIVVKPLISQAPLLKYHRQSSRTTIEKILVDVISDEDFAAWQGYESLRLYDSAFDRYTINRSKLIRYASRRGKAEEVKQIIEDLKYIED